MRVLFLGAYGFLLAVVLSGAAHAQFDDKKYGVNIDEESLTPWQELEAAPPEYPRPENYVEFYVSAATPNKFFIDAKSLSVGTDSVVRYVVAIKTPSGVSNVSFEGLHCDTYERRVYALGRSDKTWSLARAKAWTPIPSASPNGYQPALSKEYFCPNGRAILSAEEGLDALKRGGHPSLK